MQLHSSPHFCRGQMKFIFLLVFSILLSLLPHAHTQTIGGYVVIYWTGNNCESAPDIGYYVSTAEATSCTPAFANTFINFSNGTLALFTTKYCNETFLSFAEEGNCGLVSGVPSQGKYALWTHVYYDYMDLYTYPSNVSINY